MREKLFLRLPGSLLAAVVPSSGRYQVIDFLRGLAAIAVLLWHFQHFSYHKPEDVIPLGTLLDQPMSSVLWPFYTGGFYAVQLFWAISGFVFAAVYAGQNRSTRSFVVARFARLYPLAFITLIVVTILQTISIERTGSTQLYTNFDVYHFLLNLFMASSWGLERGFSFNVPIWSVSVEIVIYAVFWLSHRQLFRWGLLGPLVATVFFAAAEAARGQDKILSCGFYFFGGCTLYVLHRALGFRAQASVVAAMVVIACLLLRNHFNHAITLFTLATVLACAVVEKAAGRHVARLHWIGDSTYSLYLWHIPVQIVLLLVVANRSVFGTKAFLIAFVVGMMALARLSFVLIERPLRDGIQRRLSIRSAPFTDRGQIA